MQIHDFTPSVCIQPRGVVGALSARPLVYGPMRLVSDPIDGKSWAAGEGGGWILHQLTPPAIPHTAPSRRVKACIWVRGARGFGCHQDCGPLPARLGVRCVGRRGRGHEPHNHGRLDTAGACSDQQSHSPRRTHSGRDLKEELRHIVLGLGPIA